MSLSLILLKGSLLLVLIESRYPSEKQLIPLCLSCFGWCHWWLLKSASKWGPVAKFPYLDWTFIIGSSYPVLIYRDREVHLLPIPWYQILETLLWTWRCPISYPTGVWKDRSKVVSFKLSAPTSSPSFFIFYLSGLYFLYLPSLYMPDIFSIVTSDSITFCIIFQV